MKTSAEGIAFLERHEGVVLKAYRDPVGVWTIGAGLTKHSGVVTPKAGMEISRKQASQLLAKALSAKYEPRVAKAMPGAKQHEFDGGVSFDWNLGRIHNASWVKAWHAKDWPRVEAGIKAYRKAGGRVLPGLVRRRAEEFDLILLGNYRPPVMKIPASTLAELVVPLGEDEIAALRADFAALGYPPAGDERGVSYLAVTNFQRDHDLTDDGIIGRATLSTVQRMIDARAKAKSTAVYTGGATGGAGVGGAAEALPADQMVWLAGGVVAVGLIVAVCLAWAYRDAVAVKLQRRFPKIATKLRSI